MESNNITGLTLTDRKYRSFGQEGVPSYEGSPVFQLGGGIFTTGGFAYSHLDAVPFHFTSDGKLMTDTELEVSGVVIGNVKTFSTDNTAPNAAYGKIGADQTLIAQTSGGVLAVQSGTAWACSGLNYAKVIPSGTFYSTVEQSGTAWACSGLNYGYVIPSGTFYSNIPAGSVIVTNKVEVSGLNYNYAIPSGTFILGSQTIYSNVFQGTTPWVISGIITIGSVSVDVDEIYVTSGNMWIASGNVTVAHSGTFYVASNPTGTFWTSVSPSGTFYSNIQAGSVIVTNIVAVSGNNYSTVIPSGTFYSTVSPSGTFILGSQTGYVDLIQSVTPWGISGTVTISGNLYTTVVPSGTFYVTSAQSGTFYNTVSPSGTFYSNIQAGSIIVTNTVACSGLNYGYVIPSGTFILGSQTIYVNTTQTTTPWAISGAVNQGTTPWSMKPVANTTSFTVQNAAGSYVVFSPVAGSKFVLTDVMISAESANNVSLYESGVATGVFMGFFGANGGLVSNLNTAIKGVNAGSQLMMVTSAAGSVSVTTTGYSEA